MLQLKRHSKQSSNSLSEDNAANCSIGKVVTVTKYIPNFNSFSTLIDRLSIENVKLAHFEYLREQDPTDTTILKKISTQKEVIELLKAELTVFMKKIFTEGSYQTLEEKRTFL